MHEVSTEDYHEDDDRPATKGDLRLLKKEIHDALGRDRPSL